MTSKTEVLHELAELRDRLLGTIGNDYARDVENIMAMLESPPETNCARDLVLEEAAMICTRMVVGGRAWTQDQAKAAEVLEAAAAAIRDLKTDHVYAGPPLSEDDLQRLSTQLQSETATAQTAWDAVNSLIKEGALPGNGWDKTAERNGLILAANVIACLPGVRTFKLSPEKTVAPRDNQHVNPASLRSLADDVERANNTPGANYFLVTRYVPGYLRIAAEKIERLPAETAARREYHANGTYWSGAPTVDLPCDFCARPITDHDPRTHACPSSERDAKPVAWRYVVDSPYELRPRYAYSETEIRGATPLYTRP